MSSLGQLRGAVRCSYEKGDYLVYQGEKIDYVYYLVSGICIGAVETEEGNEFLQDEIVSGKGVCSVAALGMVFDNQGICTNGILALTKVECYRIETKVILEYLMANPGELIAFLANLMSKYVEVVKRYNSRCQIKTMDRLCQFILSHSEDHDGHLILGKRYSNQDLAKYMGVHPVTLSRMLTALKEKGYISKTQAGWKVLNLDGLVACAQGLERVQYRGSD